MVIKVQSRHKVTSAQPAVTPGNTASSPSRLHSNSRLFASCAVLALAGVLVPGAYAQHSGSFSQKDLAPQAANSQAASPLMPTPAAMGPDVPAATRSKALADLFHEMWEDTLRHSPTTATSIGDLRYNDLLDDQSAAAYDAALARGANFLTRLAAIDTTGLASQEKLSKDLMVEQLVQQQEEAQFKPWEMPVSQFNGLQVDLPQLASMAPFKTVKDYDDWIARLHAAPQAFAQVTDDIEAGIADKRTPPAYILQKVLAQTQAIVAMKPEDSPFARPLTQFPASIPAAEQTRIRTALLAALKTDVLPAYARFAKFLQTTYIPAGRAEPGVWSLPDGVAYYAFVVKQSTTTDLTPDQIHQIGVEQVAADEAQMLAIAHKLGYKDIAALRIAVAADPKQHPTSAEALLADYRKYLDAMQAKLPQYFGLLPHSKLQVEEVPAYEAKDQAPAFYQGGTVDGSRPGQIFINTYDYQHRSLDNVQTIAYHEGIPGHHLQISIAQSLTALPDFRRYGGYTAYTEGWGLYAEKLGSEISGTDDPYAEYGRLETDVFRAVRLVVDTGVHSQHWSRQQMIDYFHAHSGLDDATINSETDRYVAWPAQALGYKIGQLQILKLRSEAQAALGAKFDYKGFHDTVLGSGPLPMDILADQVHAWIVQQGGKVPTAAEGAGK